MSWVPRGPRYRPYGFPGFPENDPVRPQNWLARLATRAGKFTVGYSGSLFAYNKIPVLQDATPQGFWASLSGSANPYTATPCYPTPGGSWEGLGSSLTVSAYETHGATGLNGQHVWLEPLSTANTYLFSVPKLCSPTVVCVAVTDFCAGALSGASLTLSSGTNTYGPVLSTGQVRSVNVFPVGSGYDPDNPPTTVFTGGGGSGASGDPIFTGGSIVSVSVSAGGTGYVYVPAVGLSGGSPATTEFDPASLTAVMGLDSAGITLDSGGSGYTNGTNYALGFNYGGGSGAAGLFDVVGGSVTNVRITNPGTGWLAPPTFNFTAGGSGTGASGTVTLKVVSVTIVNGGKFYRSTPTLSFSAGVGSGAAATCSVSTISILGVHLTSGGAGYTGAPTVSFSGGSGSGAAGTTTIAVVGCFDLSTIVPDTYTLTVSDSGYTTQTFPGIVVYSPCLATGFPTTVTLHPSMTTFCITITACGGLRIGCTSVSISGTSAGGNSFGPVNPVIGASSLSLTSGGSGYTNGTGYALGFSGGGGSGAAGTFDVVAGSVTNLVLTSAGSGYTSTPTISFPGAGSGTGAAGTATMKAKVCVTVVPDAYTVTATGDCGSSSTFINELCPHDITLDVPGPMVTFTILSCEGSIPATGSVTLSYPFGSPATSSLNGAGQTGAFCVPCFGSYTWTYNGVAGCYVDPGPQTVNVTTCTQSVSYTITGDGASYTLHWTDCQGTNGLSGIVVTATSHSGGPTVTGTTNGSGLVTIVLESGCTYDITATGPNSRWATNFSYGTLTAVCGSHSVDHGVFPAASGYHCTGCCPEPLPNTLKITDGNGVHTATFDISSVTWWVCYIAPSQTVQCDVSGICTNVTYQTAVRYDFGTVFGCFTLQQTNLVCGTFPFQVPMPSDCTGGTPSIDPTPCPGGHSGAGNGASVGVTAAGCTPINLTFSFPPVPMPSSPYPVIQGGVTVTE